MAVPWRAACHRLLLCPLLPPCRSADQATTPHLVTARARGSAEARSNGAASSASMLRHAGVCRYAASTIAALTKRYGLRCARRFQNLGAGEGSRGGGRGGGRRGHFEQTTRPPQPPGRMPTRVLPAPAHAPVPTCAGLKAW